MFFCKSEKEKKKRRPVFKVSFCWHSTRQKITRLLRLQRGEQNSPQLLSSLRTILLMYYVKFCGPGCVQLHITTNMLHSLNEEVKPECCRCAKQRSPYRLISTNSPGRTDFYLPGKVSSICLLTLGSDKLTNFATLASI